MASLRKGTRKDGSTYVQVLYRSDGKQTSTSFEDIASATKFKKLIEKFGPAGPTLPLTAQLTPNRHQLITHSSDHHGDGRIQHGPRRASRAA
jgi:hypothetical protein